VQEIAERTSVLKRSTPINKMDEDTILKVAVQNPLHSMKALVKDNLYFFIQYFWSCYQETPFEKNWHIEYNCKELETVARNLGARNRKLYDLIFNQPPGTTKTAVVSIFFPVWCWVNWYWMRFITSSHSSTLSLESAEYSRDVIRSEKFQAMFPEIDIKTDKDNKSNFRVVKKVLDLCQPGQQPRVINGGGRVSTSVDARIMGFHGDILIWDDLIDAKRAFSDVELKNANDYLDQGLSTRKTSKANSVMIGMMQRLAENDPTEHQLKKKIKIKHICLPGQIIDYLPQLEPKELESKYVNGLLDPKRLGWVELEAMEADLGQYGYAAQVGQKPTKPGGGMFRVDHFQVIPVMPPEVSVIKTVRYWDKAGTDEAELKKGKDAAYTAGIKMSLLANGKWLVWGRKKGRWGTDEREAIILETAQSDGTNVEVWIEQEPGSGGKDSARGTIRNLAGFCIQSETTSGKGDKVRRADPYSVQVNRGNVLILRGDWNDDYIKEHENFPFGTYKDQVDASSGAFNQLTRGNVVEVLK